MTGLGDPLVLAAGALAVASMWPWPRAASLDPAPTQKKADDQADPRGEKPTVRYREHAVHWLERLGYRLPWVRQPVDLMCVDGVYVNRDRLPHCLWDGPTGIGKSHAVAVTRVLGERPTLIASCDISDPMRYMVERLGRRGVIWDAEHGARYGDGAFLGGWDVLAGSSRRVSGKVMDAFLSGGAGVMKRAVRTRLTEVLDDLGPVREWPDVLEGLKMHGNESQMRAQAIDLWLARFEDIYQELGPALGSELNVTDCLREGKTVLMQVDSFQLGTATEDVVVLMILEAIRAAREVAGGFNFIIEEAGQVDERINDAVKIFRAGRRRGVHVDIITHRAGDVKPLVRSLCRTKVIFQQEEPADQKAAADMTGRYPEDFNPAVLGEREAWLRNGATQKLVHFPPLPKHPKQRAERPYPLRVAPLEPRVQVDRTRPARRALALPANGSHTFDTGVTKSEAGSVKGELVVEPEPVPDPGSGSGSGADLPAWLRNETQLRNTWSMVDRGQPHPDGSAGYWRSRYAKANGYPRCRWRKEIWQHHMLYLVLAQGLDPFEVRMKTRAKLVNVDHLCATTDCVNPACLRWRSLVGHGIVTWQRRRKVASHQSGAA
jgi:hypothetical protein